MFWIRRRLLLSKSSEQNSISGPKIETGSINEKSTSYFREDKNDQRAETEYRVPRIDFIQIGKYTNNSGEEILSPPGNSKKGFELRGGDVDRRRRRETRDNRYRYKIQQKTWNLRK